MLQHVIFDSVLVFYQPARHRQRLIQIIFLVRTPQSSKYKRRATGVGFETTP